MISRRGGKALATGPPWFLAYPLFDGDSTAFGDFIRERIHDLGAAWGEEVIGIRIGHPGVRDEVYEGMRSAGRTTRDDEAVAEYERLVALRGGAQNHELRETRDLARRLGVASADLPAIAFQTEPAAGRPAVLRIRRQWLARPEDQLTMSRALQERLAPPWVLPLVEDKIPVADLIRRMQVLLDAIDVDIQRRMVGRRSRLPAGPYVLDNEIASHRLVIERETHRVFLDRQEVLPLTKQLFNILVQLAEAASDDRVCVARDELSQTVWHVDAVDDHAIDSAISRLRRALRDARSLIETRPGIGHQLRLPPADIRVL